MIRYKGKAYPTKRALANKLKINYDTLNMRMSRGLSLRQAIEFKPKSTIKYKKKEYHSYQHLIDSLGLNLTVNQIQYRLKKCGNVLDKAIQYKVASTEVVYKRKKYSSLKKLCDDLGLVYSTIKNRINRQGKSLDQAVAMSLSKSKRPKAKPKRVAKGKKVALRSKPKMKAKPKAKAKPKSKSKVKTKAKPKANPKAKAKPKSKIKKSSRIKKSPVKRSAKSKPKRKSVKTRK